MRSLRGRNRQQRPGHFVHLQKRLLQQLLALGLLKQLLRVRKLTRETLQIIRLLGARHRGAAATPVRIDEPVALTRVRMRKLN